VLVLKTLPWHALNKRAVDKPAIRKVDAKKGQCFFIIHSCIVLVTLATAARYDLKILP
jgi:hypothetical protein